MDKCSTCIYPIVIGIGGATRSGKSTLADGLRKKCFCVVDVINQDDYFKVRFHYKTKKFMKSDSSRITPR